MDYEYLTTATLQRWATAIHERNLTDVALPLLDVLQVWGFVGGQLLWMLLPFLGQDAVGALAEALENPESLQQLQTYLTEGEAHV